MKKKIKSEQVLISFVLLLILLVTVGERAGNSQTSDGYYNDFESSTSLANDGFYEFANQGTNITFIKSAEAAYNGSYGLFFQSIPKNGAVGFQNDLDTYLSQTNYLSFYVKQSGGASNVRIQIGDGQGQSIFLDIGQDPALSWEPNNNNVTNTGLLFYPTWEFDYYNLTKLVEKALNLPDCPLYLTGFTPKTLLSINFFQDVNSQMSTLYLDDLRFSPTPITPNSQKTAFSSQTNFITISTSTAGGFQFEMSIFLCIGLVFFRRLRTDKK